MSLHYTEIVEPIFKDFMKELKEYPQSAWGDEKWMGAAFYKALCNNIEQLTEKHVIEREVLEHTDKSYLNHVEEKAGLMIGKAINKNKECYHLYSEDNFMGHEVRKTVAVIKLGKRGEK